VGVVTTRQNSPLPGHGDGGQSGCEAIRATVSGSDGVYSFADLPPAPVSHFGCDGYEQVALPALEVLRARPPA